MKKIQQNTVITLFAERQVSFAKVYINSESFALSPFIFQNIKVEYNQEGYERIENKGKGRKAFRFCNEHIGNYIICFYDGNGREIKKEVFESVASAKMNKVKFANSFCFDNGKSLIPIGINLCFPEFFADSNGMEFGKSDSFSYLGLRQYEDWIKRCSLNGINLIRIWCGHAYFDPDLENMGEYNYGKFTLLDKIFNLANKYKIRIKLTFEKFRHFTKEERKSVTDLTFEKYQKCSGKLCEDDEWLNCSHYRDLWLTKIAEYSKRYSCDPALFAVELWNEMNCFGNMQIDDINNWNRYMADKVRELFPNCLILNSLGSLDGDWSINFYKNFCFEKFDYLQFHSYLDQGAEIDEVRENSIEGIKKCIEILSPISQKIKKPLFLAETGAVNNHHSAPFRYYLQDDEGLFLVDSVYTPFFLGCVGSGNIWHWDGRYVSSKNLFKFFKPLSTLLKDIDYVKENFKTLDFSNDKAYIFILSGKEHTLVFIRNKAYSWKNVLRDKIKIKRISLKIDSAAFNVKEIKKIPIWGDDKFTIDFNKGLIEINGLKKGTLLKFSK